MISKETEKIITDFRDAREWRQFHNPKDLAISISLEAAELLEIFQWSGADLVCAEKLNRIKEELADVLCYSILLSDRLGLDMDEIIREKMKKNAEKYPAELCRGSSAKYTEIKSEKEKIK